MGAGSGLVYSQTLDAPRAAKKSFQYRHDGSLVRRDDVYLIGGIVGALLTPAICESVHIPSEPLVSIH